MKNNHWLKSIGINYESDKLTAIYSKIQGKISRFNIMPQICLYHLSVPIRVIFPSDLSVSVSLLSFSLSGEPHPALSSVIISGGATRGPQAEYVVPGT